MGIFAPNKSKYAYQGELTCPHSVDEFGKPTLRGTRLCGSKAIRYIEDVNAYRIRYRCRKCGGTFQYDISGRNDLNPYADYEGGSIWRAIKKITQGRNLKGGIKQ